MGKECPKCKAENTEDSQFCKKCATQLEADIVHTKTMETPIEELTRGSTFARRYEIIEELGSGGMGRVYRVEDKKTREELALKLIKPEIASDKKTIERFSNELTITHKITHKNVCRMFHLGEDKGTYYITMEYVRGEDLKNLIRRVKRLDTGTALSIGKQICSGLGEAHGLGVIHRDLKPANIMVDNEGSVRIMDFGIARTLRTKGITGDGVMIGTPEYMSPEQVEAKDVDNRSDIYSLGIILFEMLTGQTPFKGETPIDVGIKHKSESPEDPKKLNPQIPDELSQVILKCLEKGKEKRYKSVGELSPELERIEKLLPATERVEVEKPVTSKEITVSIGLKKLLIPVLGIIVIAAVVGGLLKILTKKESVPVTKEITSIAVLPFEDMSPQKDQEYFCDGMTDEIIAKLSALEGLKVISRTSVMRYKNTDKDIKEIGSDLGVGTILEGSVRKEKNKIRVTIQLVNVKDRFQIWTESYDQKLERVFDIQSDIAENIAKSLEAKLSPEVGERLQKKPTENMEAYRLYLQGLYSRNKRTMEGLKLSVDYFEKAIQIDPDYALAYAGLAGSYNLFGLYVGTPSKESFPKAKQAAVRALELDDSLADAHTNLGYAKIRYGWDWAGAEEEYKMAIKLNPNDAITHLWYAELLASDGRFEEAMAEIKQAEELDPVSLIVNSLKGYVYMWARDYDSAISQLKRTIQMEPDFPMAHNALGLANMYSENFAEAIAEFKTSLNLSPDSSMALGYLGQAYARAGKRSEAMGIIRELEDRSLKRYVAPYWILVIYEGLGEKDKAFELLEKAIDERNETIIWLKIGPYYDGLRSDPRFTEILQKVGLRMTANNFSL